MREIKFKAFCQVCNKFIGADYRYHIGGLEATCPNHNVFTACQILENTGLHDKNNTLIFEGDICKRINHRKSVEMALVKFIDGAFYPERFSENNTLLDCNSEFYDQCEVIGNIYEHSHLLENKP